MVQPIKDPNQKPSTAGDKQSKKDLSNTLEKKAEVKTSLPSASKPTVPAVRSDYDMLKDFMARHKADFEMVIPSHLKPERVIRLAVAACRRNPELLTCDLSSVMGGLLESASLGLEVNSPLHHASLIPRNNNKTRKKEACFQMEYRGYVELFLRHPKVLTVFANSVYERDIFTVQYGTNEKLEHTELEEKDRGEIKGFYAYVKMTNDAYRFVYLSKAKVDAIRDEYSDAYKAAKKTNDQDTPWIKNYESMGMKTALLRLERFVPKSPELGRGIEADFKVIDPLDADFVPPLPPETPETEGDDK